MYTTLTGQHEEIVESRFPHSTFFMFPSQRLIEIYVNDTCSLHLVRFAPSLCPHPSRGSFSKTTLVSNRISMRRLLLTPIHTPCSNSHLCHPRNSTPTPNQWDTHPAWRAHINHSISQTDYNSAAHWSAPELLPGGKPVRVPCLVTDPFCSPTAASSTATSATFNTLQPSL